jgi:hypothetical protein
MPRDYGDDAKPSRDARDGRSNTKLQETIGRSLKAHYNDLVHAPVPDKFLELLAQLELKEQHSPAQESDDERR